MTKKKIKRKSRPIVIGHLEKISSSVFEDYPQQVTRLIKEGQGQGVYALYRRAKLYYVGLASDLQRRIKWHLKDKHKGKWDRFSLYMIRKTDHIREVEALLVRISEPKGNRVKGKLGRSKNLMRELQRAVKQQQNEERMRIFSQRKGKVKHKPVSKRRVKTTPVERPMKGLLRNYQRIYCSYKGNDFKARVLPNGIIELLPSKRKFDSPSMAGIAVTKKKTINGWRFWKYKNNDGILAYIDKLRK